MKTTIGEVLKAMYRIKNGNGTKAANYTDHTPNYLDGMVGCDKLRDFRKYYKLEE